MASNKTYSFLDVVCALTGPGGVVDLGAGAGNSDEGITVSSAGPINEMTVGADGSGMHSLLADRSGTFTISLLKTSPINAILMAMYNLQTTSAALHGQNTIVIADKALGDTVTGQGVAFTKAPDLNYAKTAGMTVWEFQAITIDRAIGGIV